MNYSLTNQIYIHLNACNEITDFELLLLYISSWNNLTVFKQIINSK